jgi:hypothetical protein
MGGARGCIKADGTDTKNMIGRTAIRQLTWRAARAEISDLSRPFRTAYNQIASSAKPVKATMPP